MELPINKILCGDALKLLKKLPENSVHCIVTSPPYWCLRDYGIAGQLGMEDTPSKYAAALVRVFKEAKRVLRNDGTLWLNIGDSYAAAPKSRTAEQAARRSTLTGSKGTQISCSIQPNKVVGSLKAKDLVGIPWMVAFALRKAGWYLRCDIIWSKPNPMPESVTDRPTKAHEYIFLLTKSDKYYYDADAIKTIAKNPEDDARRIGKQSWGNKNTPDQLRNGIRPRKSGNLERKPGSERGCPSDSTSNVCGSVPWEGMKANKRSVWTVPTKPFAEAHFATFPPELITDCIKAGCPEGGIVLDPFMGAGTTALVSAKLNRNYIGIELNPSYIEISEKRLQSELGLFKNIQDASTR